MTGDQHEVVSQLVEIIVHDWCGGEEHRVEHDTDDGECDESLVQQIDFEMTRDAQMTSCLRVNGRHGPSSLKMGDHGKPWTWEDNTARAGALQHSQKPGDCRTSWRRQVFWLVGSDSYVGSRSPSPMRSSGYGSGLAHLTAAGPRRIFTDFPFDSWRKPCALRGF